MSTSQIALFDTNAGFLQWIGTAETHKAAIRAHLEDVGFNADVEHGFRAIDVTDEQAEAVSAWWDAGADASEYPVGLPSGAVYDHGDVVAAVGTQ